MSQPETTGPVGNLYGLELPTTSLPKLTEIAREAYEQKRTKDCLDLTRAMLLIDPENPEAHLMRASIRAEMNQDLENARALLRDAQAHLQTIDESDENDENDEQKPASDELQPEQEIFVAATSTRVTSATETSRPSPRFQWWKRAIAISSFCLVAAGLPLLRSKSSPIEPALALKAPGAVTLPNVDQEATRIDTSLAPPAPASETTPLSAPAPVELLANDRPSEVTPPAPRPAPPKPKEQPLPAPGKLAVSSPTSVDIYRDDAYVGSAPVTLDLPAGTQTLEYRHGTLRKRMTHVINSNQTSRAMVSFETTVQINSRPWAEVFLDGSEKKLLGQTPLSGVQVPIGSVLIFESPQFPSKRYRVTGNESGIQIVFP